MSSPTCVLSQLTREEWDAVIACKRDGTLLQKLQIGGLVKPTVPFHLAEQKLLTALAGVGQRTWSDFCCDGKFKLLCDDDPGIYYFCDFRKTLKQCIRHESVHFNAVVDQMIIPDMKTECEPWKIYFAIGGQLVIDTTEQA